MPLLYQTAREQAASLLDEHWDGNLPVRLSHVTAALQAEKFETSLHGISGFVTKTSGQRARIVLNSDESPARRRFTWGHELGHIVDRATIAKDPDYAFTDTRNSTHYDLHEFFADEFAGALLMPEQEILRMRRNGNTLGDMAKAFEVNVSAVKMRLKRLDKNPE